MRRGELIIVALHERVQEIVEFLEPVVIVGSVVYLAAQVARVLL